VAHEPDDTAQLESRIAAELVTRIGQGDQQAENEMCRRYRRGLVFLIKRRTGDSDLAEDLCQIALLTALEKLRASSIENPERLAAFLRGIAVNLLIGDRRKSARRATNPDSEAVERSADESRGPMEHVSGEQTQRAVRLMLEELRVERDRDILISVYLNDEDKESICQRHSIDATHFNRVLFRAKKRFRELIERQGRLELVE